MTHSISKNTFQFLKKLKLNNNREWFTENKDLYLAAKENMTFFMDEVIAHLAETDINMLKFEGKKTLFRIFRDVRFSLDKTPYKNHFGAALGMGKNNRTSGFYLHVAPGNSFLAGGVYVPEKDILKKIRLEISSNPSAFLKIINDKGFQNTFTELSDEDKLKRIPQDFDKDDALAEFLKLKSFVAKCPLSDRDLEKPDSAKKVADLAELLKPLNAFIEEAILKNS